MSRELDELLGNAYASRTYPDTANEQLYIDGIVLVRRWRDEAVISGHAGSIKSFNRILEGAIEQYETLFKKAG